MKCRNLTKRAFRKTLMFKAFVIGLYNAFMSLSDVMYIPSCHKIPYGIPHGQIEIKKELKNKED